MSKTIKRDNPRPFNKERTSQRRAWNRRVRRAMNQAVRLGTDAVQPRRTSGWLTW